MNLPWIHQLGEWNPQFFREIKGRLKPRNIFIAVTMSLLGQLLLLMNFASQIPTPYETTGVITNRYCTGTRQEYGSPTCIADGLGGFVINWELWWKDVFIWLSIFGVFALLVIGTYMLIADLGKEEHRGTLNFLRLTPQSSRSILIGKMLGVPVLLYLVGLLALPLHLAAGLSAQIPLSFILVYDSVLGASCLFFYSFALLFGLVGRWLGGFQPWLGSGLILMFLFPLTGMLSSSSYIMHNPLDWLILFNPEVVLLYLINSNSLDAASTANYGSNLRDLSYFSLPIAANVWIVAGFMGLNYGLWAYWAWQGLQRCFHNPSATLLGKQQSYWLTACFEAVMLGFALNPEVQSWKPYAKGLFENFQILLIFNLLLFLGLIALLSPQRQAMQDWARYRHKQRSTRKRSVMADLLWAEKSPALVAVGVNLAIASVILLPWILLWPQSEFKIPTLSGLLLNASLVLLYATIAQLILFAKSPKRSLWAASTVGGLVILPPIIFGFLSLTPMNQPAVWLFSAFPWASLEYATTMSIVLAVIGQSLAFGLLSLKLTQQLRKAGESSTKALLSGRSPVAIQ